MGEPGNTKVAAMNEETGMSKPVTVVRERVSGLFVDPPQWAYHLAKGRSEDVDWQEIWCGGGIAFPSGREKVAADMVCPACKSARRDA